MRILVVQDWLRGHGGAEAFVTLLRDGLRTAGNEVRLMTSSAGTAGDGTADFVAFGTERRAAQALLQIVNPFAVATVRRAVREFKPDVAVVNMFAHHLSPAALAALGDIPTVLVVSDYKVICPVGSKLLPNGTLCQEQRGWTCYRSGCVNLLHWMRDQPRYALIRAELGRPKRILAVSRWVQRELTAAGIESDILTLPVLPRSPGFRRCPASAPAFVYFGRLDREKGVALLLRAFAWLQAQVPGARLRIIGRGPEQPALERTARELRLTDVVTFLGWLSLPDIEHQLRDAWATVVPSLWAEPLGMVAPEAIVRGVPVIASAAGGLGEVVEHGVTGLLVPNNDEHALTEALRAVAQSDVFPHHTLPDDVVARASAAYGVDRYVEGLRQVLDDVTAAASN
jgi:glycosyltransferase involved in cell wall biosynthesis